MAALSPQSRAGGMRTFRLTQKGIGRDAAAERDGFPAAQRRGEQQPVGQQPGDALRDGARQRRAVKGLAARFIDVDKVDDRRFQAGKEQSSGASENEGRGRRKSPQPPAVRASASSSLPPG